MMRSLLVLGDGTELYSGPNAVNAIQSVKITEMVNNGQELVLGSTCASMLEARIVTPGGNLTIAAGSEITVYKVDTEGQRHMVGLFTTEKPTHPSANSLNIVAYDRVTWLDKDLSMWLYNLNGWPYSLFDFAGMVCQECGLELKNEELPNGSYMIHAFSGEGITGRQLMQWVGQVAGRFCRATSDGKIEFAWYAPVESCTIGANKAAGIVSYNSTGNLSFHSEEITAEEDGEGNVTISSDLISVADDGMGGVQIIISEPVETILYYQGGLSFEDYAVAPVEKVQLQQNAEDVGTVYPADIAEAVNTYTITGNYLLTASTADDLVAVAQTLYEQLKNVSYTPCKVSIPAQLNICAGDIVQITDRNGKTITAYVMKKTQNGQKDTLECTGSTNRGSSTAVNNQKYEALVGKVLNLRMDVEGIKAENADTAGNLAAINLSLEGISSTVQTQESTVDGLRTNLTKLEQTSAGISAKVEGIQNNGVDKVSTEFGLTINESAVTIHRSGSEMTNRLNERGMYVIRDEGSSGEAIMLKADADGVIATDVSVRNYLIVGSHARFEDYNNGTDAERTACFWV